MRIYCDFDGTVAFNANPIGAAIALEASKMMAETDFETNAGRQEIDLTLRLRDAHLCRCVV